MIKMMSEQGIPWQPSCMYIPPEFVENVARLSANEMRFGLVLYTSLGWFAPRFQAISLRQLAARAGIFVKEAHEAFESLGAKSLIPETLMPLPDEFLNEGEWCDHWYSLHTDLYHPSTREECSHCQQMIEESGPMPPLELLRQYQRERQRREDEEKYRKKPISRKVRQAVLLRDNHACMKCGSQNDLCADHVFPEALGGTPEKENLQTLCRSCNSRKGARV